MSALLTQQRQAQSLTGRARRSTVGRAALTLGAASLVWVSLVAPETPGFLSPFTLVRIPIEGLLVVAVALALRPTRRRWVLLPVGVVLALLLVVRLLDLVFRSVYYRDVDLLNDVGYVGAAVDLLATTEGRPVAVAATAFAVLLVLGLLIALPLALRRLARLVDRRRGASVRTMGLLAVAWVVLAAYGVALTPGVPLASWSTAALASQQIRATVSDLRDRGVFAKDIAVDSYKDAQGPELLSGLRGKDVVIVFVESYGQVALDGSSLVDATLAQGTERLRAQGYASRSAWLTSPTFGGLSWLAHSTLQSGLWVDTQQRYDRLMTTDRLTLSRAFARAGWRTVGVVPANRRDWPEGASFYGYDAVYDSRTLGYAGPPFGYASMPDQYTLAALDRLELTRPGRGPVMAEVDLVTSHAPWAPLPRLVDWASIGNGSLYGPMASEATPKDVVWRSTEGVRTAYAQSIAYSLESVLSFLQNTRDDNLVILVLGDHQPAAVVSGDHATHEVPVSVISRDPAVLDRISGWGWDDGLQPRPDAPVWPMDRFRDRFLAAYGADP